jgi:hypothetical protein
MQTTRTVSSFRAVELSDSVEGIIRGYVFIWGTPDTKDAYNTYFDRSRPPRYSYSGDLAGYPIAWEHGQDPAVGQEAVGVITRTWFDDVGLAFEGQLDKGSPYFERAFSDVSAGRKKTSSSSALHMSKWYEDGAFRNWWLTELSLVDNPAEYLMPSVTLIRSAGDDRDDHSDDNSTETPLPEDQPSEALRMDAPQEGTATVMDALNQLVTTYGLEAVQAAIGQMQSPSVEMSDPAAAPRSADALGELKKLLEAKAKEQEAFTLRSDMNTLRDELKALRAAPPTENGDRVVRGGNHISVSEERKYWGMSDEDAMFAYKVMRARGIAPSDEFMTTLGGRAVTGMEKNTGIYQDRYLRSLMPRATRANEVAISTASGGGDEWVAIAWSNSIWEVARNNRIYDQLKSKGMREVEVPKGHESTYITTEGADPTVYTIAQDADLAASGRPDVNVGVSRIGTGRVLLTPGELGMAVVYSDVFEEDSIVGVAAQYNQQMREKAQETIEQLFLNGDTVTSTTNINYDDGTPGTGLSVPYYIASDGARKYALVTGSSTSRSGGTLDENDFRLTLKLFPSPIRTRKGQIAFIIDSDTHNTALDIAAVKTEDVKRTNATIEAGVLTKIYGVDVFESGFLPLTASDGKVTYNAAGTLGTLLAIYAPYWAVGMKRNVTVETDRDILSGTNIIVAKMRIGFQYRGAGAAVASYNLTIA